MNENKMSATEQVKEQAEAPKVGDKVRVQRSSGENEEDWTLEGYEDGKAVVTKLNEDQIKGETSSVESGVEMSEKIEKEQERGEKNFESHLKDTEDLNEAMV